jgi:hypothetical protein
MDFGGFVVVIGEIIGFWYHTGRSVCYLAAFYVPEIDSLESGELVEGP